MHLEISRGSRQRILAILTLVIMAVFVGRLFYLQIIKHGYYVAQANAEQVKQLVIPAKRGEIYAMDGDTPVPMVLNQTVYTVFADPVVVDQPNKLVDAIEQIAGANAQPDLPQLLKRTDTRYQVMATKVTEQQAQLLKAKNFHGLGFQAESQRVYPEGQLAAQTLGFVNASGQGVYGIEGGLNNRLAGKDGMLKTVTDISNVPLTIGKENVDIPAKNGDNIVMTIDRNVQSEAEKALQDDLKNIGATNGSVEVVDPENGHVLAMANFPTYNPANYGQVQDAADFNNDVISLPYEPGSVMKTFTLTTGIDTGTVTPNSTYNNTDYITVGGQTITNASHGQTGMITLQHALNWSLNTGMVTVAERLGDGQHITLKARNTMYDYLHNKFHLGEATGIQLAGEEAGIVPEPTINGAAVQYATMSFGQGMDITMAQVTAAFSAMINGGTYYHPTVVAGTMGDDGSTFTPAKDKAPEKNLISAQTSAEMRDMIVKAREAFYAGGDRKGFMIGGKTGTSQTLENGKYVDNQTVATYLGFGGEKGGMPRYVIMARVAGKNMQLEGDASAMPIFTDISNWMIDYLKLQPKG